MSSREEQIRAIIGMRTWKWGLANLPAGKSIDDVRFQDLVSVTEDDVYEYVLEHGFDPSTVAVRDEARRADDRICLVPEVDGRWRVYYTERGQVSDETVLPSEAHARREVVARLMRLARINLNHRYRLAHPDEDLPPPDEM